MIYLLIFLLMNFSFAETSSEWKMGKEVKSLVVVKHGFVSKSCLKECDLKKLIKTNQHKRNNLSPVGGQNPRALLCLAIGADIIYMSQKNSEDAFCQKDGDIISLSLIHEI